MSLLQPLFSLSNSQYTTQLSGLCRSLKSALEIDVFWYSKTFSDGHFLFIGSRTDITEFYYSNDFYKNNPYLRHPDNYHSTMIFPYCIPRNDYLESQDPTNVKFHMDNILLVLKKEGPICHNFGFASTLRAYPIQNVYLNNIKIIQKFTEYFLKEWTPALNKMDQFVINIAQLIGPKFFEVDRTIMPVTQQSSKLKLLEKLGMRMDVAELARLLTRRERDCVRFYLQGKTSRMTADALGLSPRTVEYYFESIKRKLDCKSKSEIIGMMSELMTLDV